MAGGINRHVSGKPEARRCQLFADGRPRRIHRHAAAKAPPGNRNAQGVNFGMIRQQPERCIGVADHHRHCHVNLRRGYLPGATRLKRMWAEGGNAHAVKHVGVIKMVRPPAIRAVTHHNARVGAIAVFGGIRQLKIAKNLLVLRCAIQNVRELKGITAGDRQPLTPVCARVTCKFNHPVISSRSHC